MTENIDWSQTAANVGGIVIALLAVGAAFRKAVHDRLAMIANERVAASSVSKETYERDKAITAKEIDSLRRVLESMSNLHMEIALVRQSVEHLKEGQEESKGNIADLRSDLTGMANRLVQEIRAGSMP